MNPRGQWPSRGSWRAFHAGLARFARLWPALPLLLVALPALARVGGGQSFSGSSHYSGGDGGGSADADLVFFLIRLIIVYPQVGVPVTLVVIGIVVANQHAKGNRGSWNASGEGWSGEDGAPLEPALPTAGARRQLLATMSFDPAFSLVLFEDFLYALYAATQEARAGGKLGTLSAYLSPDALHAADLSRPARVEAVIVGGLHVIGAEAEEGRVQVRLRFESNYTEEDAGGRGQTFYAAEVWTLGRSMAARSRPPDRARVLACPSCGGPLENVIAGKCSYCGKEVATGEFDWLVSGIEIFEREARAPDLFAEAPPDGPPPPTRGAPGSAERFDAIQTRDPAFTFETFRARVDLIFQELQGAWSARDWKRARPYASERLFQEWAHWMQLYQAAHARNVVDRPRLLRLELADAQSDAHYDSITVRLWASAVDYTVSDDGKILAGHRDRERPFSEYWTLIRGARVTGPAPAEKKCPQCGAPLEINMAGRCEYCKAEVTSGQFDWVLSRIEQDAAYDG